MAEYQVLYWHDIPVQVRAGSRPNRVSFELAPRFQAAVDQVAVAAGLSGTDDYLDGSHWSEIQEREGTAEEAAATVAAELEAAFPEIDLKMMTQSIQGKDVD